MGLSIDAHVSEKHTVSIFRTEVAMLQYRLHGAKTKKNIKKIRTAGLRDENRIGNIAVENGYGSNVQFQSQSEFTLCFHA
jgi:AraC-like DNA-binding protein